MAKSLPPGITMGASRQKLARNQAGIVPERSQPRFQPNQMRTCMTAYKVNIPKTAPITFVPKTSLPSAPTTVAPVTIVSPRPLVPIQVASLSPGRPHYYRDTSTSPLGIARISPVLSTPSPIQLGNITFASPSGPIAGPGPSTLAMRALLARPTPPIPMISRPASTLTTSS
ncbi:hypothetical protein FRC07_001141, partial [Ceratobasidium sp. 392]